MSTAFRRATSGRTWTPPRLSVSSTRNIMTKHKKKVHETSCASTAVHVHGILEPSDERVGYHLEDNEHLDAMYTDSPAASTCPARSPILVQTPSNYVELEMDNF